MKQILLLASLLSLSTVNAQKATKTAKIATTTKETKPTKEETMDWLAGKMKEYLTGGREFVSYEKGIFVYQRELGGGGLSNLCKSTVDLNKLTGISDEYSSDFFVFGQGLTYSKCTNDYNGTIYNGISISGPNYKEYGVPFSFGMDTNLVERLRKAFKTLTDYNSAKKDSNEKF